MDSEKYTIDQLVEMTGYSRRAIRYYIQENLLDPPAGRGRGGFYNDSHLAHLRRIRSLQSQGMSLMAIKRLLKSGNAGEILHPREVWAKFDIAPGIEINVRRDIEASSGKKLNEIIRIAMSIMKEETEDEQVSRQDVRKALEENASAYSVVFETSAPDETDKIIVPGKIATILIPLEGKEVRCFFTKHHADYWLQKAG